MRNNEVRFLAINMLIGTIVSSCAYARFRSKVELFSNLTNDGF